MSKRKIAGLMGEYEVRRNLKRYLGRRVRVASMGGLIRAAAFIRASMDSVPPLIPVKTGVLRASWYTNAFYVEKRPVVQMGFSALYAIFVHERDWTQGTRPGSGPRFFQSALNRNRRNIRNIIASHIRQ